MAKNNLEPNESQDQDGKAGLALPNPVSQNSPSQGPAAKNAKRVQASESDEDDEDDEDEDEDEDQPAKANQPDEEVDELMRMSREAKIAIKGGKKAPKAMRPVMAAHEAFFKKYRRSGHAKLDFVTEHYNQLRKQYKL